MTWCKYIEDRKQLNLQVLLLPVHSGLFWSWYGRSRRPPWHLILQWDLSWVLLCFSSVSVSWINNQSIVVRSNAREVVQCKCGCISTRYFWLTYAVCHIAARTCSLMILHFTVVPLVRCTCLLQDNEHVRWDHMVKMRRSFQNWLAKNNIWKDPRTMFFGSDHFAIRSLHWALLM